MSKNSLKRQYGTGGITQRKDGRYQGSVYVGRDETGKLKKKYVYGKTEREVKQKIKLFLEESKQYDAINVSKNTLESFLIDWLENILIHSLKPKSYSIKEYVIKKQIVPRIGFLQLNAVTTMDIQKMLNDMSDEDFSYSTIKKAYDTLNQRFKLGILQKQVSYNPVIGVVLPTKAQKSASNIKFFSENQAKAIIIESRRQYSSGTNVYRLGELMPFLLFTGLRIGEALALEWKDVDFEKKILIVNKDVVEVKDKKTGKYIILKQDTPKTSRSNRVIPLSDNAIESLKNIKKINSNAQYIFSSQGGNYLSHSNINRTFKGIQKALGYTDILGVHSLRHTFATLMLNRNIDIKIVSELLGHANVSTTYNIYIHTVQKQKATAMNMIDLI